ncbi:MAG: hypothetical protein ACOY93_23330 [Bacillota bacterium]
MNSPLVGPGDRYRLVIEALASQDGKHFTRCRAEAGVPLGGGWLTTGAASGAPPSSFLVVVDEACSLIIQPGENGLTVREVRLLNACQVQVTASVTPGSAAPDWLGGESTYLLFDGDGRAALAQPPRYIPFDGLVSPEAWPQADFAPLDVLAVAVGRSIERANATLACKPSPGGVALVSSVTLRVGISRVDLGRNRVLLTLARPEGGEVEQFVELTLTSGLAAEADELAEGDEIGPALPDPAGEGGGEGGGL